MFWCFDFVQVKVTQYPLHVQACVWAWCGMCMRKCVNVLMADGQIRQTIVEWGYRAEDRHKHKAVKRYVGKEKRYLGEQGQGG